MSWFLILLFCFLEPSDPIVIAHRGASGYAVEHTEAAKTLAHAQDADFIEQDIVLSKDGEFVVTHDITMDETTDVEKRFPHRARKDGRYYFADFSWMEIQQLTLHERTLRGSDQPALPHRFPLDAGQRIRNEIVSTGLVELAKQSGLLVHPYTVRKYQQPKWSSSIEETHRVLVDQLHVDGFFTDYPDLGRAAVRK